MRHVIILAGGSGSRFWPLSRPQEPKQFLKVCSKNTMLEETVKRVLPLIKKENIHIACSAAHKQRMKFYINKLKVPRGNIFFEPCARNTLAPIAFLANRIYKIDPNGVIAVLPCDHYVKSSSKFLKSLKEAIAAADNGSIVTFGVIPTRPETGYGYIRVKSRYGARCLVLGARREPKTDNRGPMLYEVNEFIEKPDLEKAQRLLKDKRCYWNGGIFVFKAKTMLDEVSKLAPVAYELISRIDAGGSMERLWRKMPFVSMDCAIMEKTKKISLLPLDCGWVDLGSWQSIAEISKCDKNGNIFKGKCVNIDSVNTTVWSHGPLVLATVGLKDIIVVSTKNAVLVCAKDKTQEVRRILQILNNKKG